MAKIRVDFIVEEEQKRRLEKLSKRTHVSQSYYIREALEKVLKKYER